MRDNHKGQKEASASVCTPPQITHPGPSVAQLQRPESSPPSYVLLEQEILPEAKMIQ